MMLCQRAFIFFCLEGLVLFYFFTKSDISPLITFHENHAYPQICDQLLINFPKIKIPFIHSFTNLFSSLYLSILQFHFALSKFDLVFSTIFHINFFILRRVPLISTFTRSGNKPYPPTAHASNFLWHQKATKQAHTISYLVDVSFETGIGE